MVILKLFRRTTVLYYALSLSVLCGLPFLWIRLTDNVQKLLFFLLFLVWIYVSAIVANLYAIKLEGKIKAALNDCNTKEFIDFYRKALGRVKRRMKDYVLLNLSTGHLLSGNNETAKMILDKFNGFQNTKTETGFSFVYYNNLIIYHLRVNDLDKAEATIKKLNEVIDNPKFIKKHYKNYAQVYSSKTVMFNLYKGNYDGIEEFYRKNFEEEKTLLGKVAAKYCLGELYTRLGDNDKAVAAYEYALKNGKDTYYAKKASEYLGKPLEVN